MSRNRNSHRGEPGEVRRNRRTGGPVRGANDCKCRFRGHGKANPAAAHPSDGGHMKSLHKSVRRGFLIWFVGRAAPLWLWRPIAAAEQPAKLKSKATNSATRAAGDEGALFTAFVSVL